LQGFVDEFAAAGLVVPPAAILEGEYSHEWGFDAAQLLVASDARPDAVFCANDLLAFGAIDGARNAGMRVPEDLWVVGYDDIPMATWSGYSLTTVRQDIPRVAELAARLLVERIEGDGGAPRHQFLEPELVVRASTCGSSGDER
jgi:LacI family transcriptional regulator